MITIVINELNRKAEVYQVNFLWIVEANDYIFKFKVVMDIV